MSSSQDIKELDKSEVQQFVTFFVNKDVFAIPIDMIQEIIRVPDVVRVPLSPDSLEGLANLRGNVLPVVSLRKCFQFETIPFDDSTRVIVIELKGVLIGFIVDVVSSVISVENENIEKTNSSSSTINSDLLTGVIKKNHAVKQMVLILDINKLADREFSSILKSVADNTHFHADEDKIKLAEEEINNEIQLVSFSVANQEYALPIEKVQEIVIVPEDIIKIPKAESYILGVITLRNKLLPLVSLRDMFGMPRLQLTDQNRVVVFSLDETSSVGIVMDTVSEVLRVNRKLIDELPKLFSRNGDSKEIDSICKLNGGKRLVSILSVEEMFKHDNIIKALESAQELDNNMDERITHVEITDAEEDQIVIFKLANEEYGVPIESVQEIVRLPDELIHVPKTPDFIEGVINLRGAVLPVVDMRARFSISKIERNERQRIAVFSINGVNTGFIVDSVAEVLKIAKSDISTSPKLSEEQSKIIHSVANLPKKKRMILLLDTEQLLDTKQKLEVSKVTEN